MISVLLVKIQPMDLILDLESFPIEKQSKFDISILNDGLLHFTVSKVYYSGSEYFNEKIDEIHKHLGIDYGGHVVAIDKYPDSRFRHGATKTDFSGISRYEVECHTEGLVVDAIVLLPPVFSPIVLSTLHFAYGGDIPKGFCSSFIALPKDSVLSVTSLFGEVKGIPLKLCNKSALESDSRNLFYAMSFERISVPPIFLQKLL